MVDENEDSDDRTSDQFQRLVEEHGNQVLLHTATCVTWKAEHEKCDGCPSSLGCCKTVSLMIVSMLPLMYTPTSFDDFEAMNRSVHQKFDAILNATTDKEVKKVAC